jgi:hypothetical protein
MNNATTKSWDEEEWALLRVEAENNNRIVVGKSVMMLF